MPGVNEYFLLIAARLLSALGGYVVLAYSANQLHPALFAELVFFQTLQFLAIAAFDYGPALAATRRAAGAADWLPIAREYQSIRALFHIAVGVALFGVTSLRSSDAPDSLLPLGCALAFFSNLLNADWLLIGTGLRKRWAQKAIVVGCANVLCTVLLFSLLERPSAVLFGQALANAAGALFLRIHGLLPLGWPRLPTGPQLSDAMTLSASAIATHGAYNVPILAATMFSPPDVAGSFACLYRIFSASTLFVPITTDFAAARMIGQRQRNKPSRITLGRALFPLLITCLAAVLPFLLMPNDILARAFGAAIDLPKYGISEPHFTFYKVALALYCLDFGGQRYAYVAADNRALMLSSAIGFTVGTLGTAWLSTSSVQSDLMWFLPLFLHQLVASALVIVTVSRKLRSAGV